MERPGRILNFPNLFRITAFQYRPGFASTQAFTDLRVRQALHFGVDFPALNEAVQGGRTTQAVGPIPPTAYYAEARQGGGALSVRPEEDRAVDGGGRIRQRGGWRVGPSQRAVRRMALDINVLANPDSENEMHIMADTWRKLGFEVREGVWRQRWRPTVRRSRVSRASGRPARLGRSAFLAVQDRSDPAVGNALVGAELWRLAGLGRVRSPGERLRDQLSRRAHAGRDPDEQDHHGELRGNQPLLEAECAAVAAGLHPGPGPGPERVGRVEHPRVGIQIAGPAPRMNDRSGSGSSTTIAQEQTKGELRESLPGTELV